MALIPKNYARLESGYREHSKYTEADQYGTRVVAGEDAQKDVAAATYNPFADLKSMLNKKS